MYGFFILIAAAVLFLFWFIVSYNGLVRFHNMVLEAFSSMDVYLKKRYDLIPNLVETVRGYAAHETGTFEKVIKARNSAAGASNIQTKAEGEQVLSNTLKSLFALAESYPDLKANANFADLQKQLQGVEADIANSRRYYNAVVRDFNTRIESFPRSIVASLFRFRREALFEIGEQERKNVDVRF